MTTLIDEGIKRLSRDQRKAASELSEKEARFLVDGYYQKQEDRIETGNQIYSMAGMTVENIRKYGWHLQDDCLFTKCKHKPNVDGHFYIEPTEFLIWTYDNELVFEKQIAAVLDKYSAPKPLSQWARSVVGIGPVIAAGLLASGMDIAGSRTASRIWSFAGYGNKVWEKGQKRPHNGFLKTLCWKIGESFVMVKGHERDIYGKMYDQRKEYETAKNEAGEYAEQAANILATKNIGKDTDAYKAYAEGKLPKGHIHERSKRYAVKIFLSHYHHVGYEMANGAPPPYPFAISRLGHADMIQPPNHECS